MVVKHGLGGGAGCGLNNRRKLCCKHSQESGPAGSTWPAFCAERDYFQQMASELYGDLLPIPATGMVAIRPEDILTAYRE